MFDSGVYSLQVPSAGKSFSNVSVVKSKGFFDGITGNVAANVASGKRPYLLYSSLLLIFFSLMYMIFTKAGFKKKSSDNFNSADYDLGRKRLQELKAKGIRKDKPVEFGKASQEDIEDFRNRMVSKFNEEETKKDVNSFLDNQRRNFKDDDKPKGGLFNMFN